MSSNDQICDIAGFCRVLLASELISEPLLADVLREFQSQAKWHSTYGKSLTAFIGFLVTERRITCWQCAKLRNGQHKGFFMESYKLLDHLGDDDRCNRYLAEDTRTNRPVALCVVPPLRDSTYDGALKFWVEELHG